jgi:hypothetical protein
MDSTLYFGGAIVLGAFLWFFCAYLCYITAGKKHRRPVTWLILGIVFGPFAFAALYLMPKGGLAPAPASSGSASHGSSAAGGSGGGAPANESGAQHGGTKTQADLYEVPHKHKK